MKKMKWKMQIRVLMLGMYGIVMLALFPHKTGHVGGEAW